ncbi:hypothetical protein D3C78_337440 [compost metagenome]
MATDTHALAQVRRASEHRRFPVQAGLAQTLAKILVEVQQAGFIAQALAVWRVADHQAFLVLVRARLEAADFALVDLHPVAQACALNVVAPRLDQARVGFITTDPQRWTGQASFGAGQRFIMEFAPQCWHVAEPGAETPTFAAQVRCDIGGDHCRFDQEGPDTAHRVGQGTAFGSNTWPAGTDQYRRREVFLQWRGALLQAVTALVQAVAGQVQRQDRLTAFQAQVHAQVRVELVHRRAFAAAGAQFVDDRVLDLQGAEMGVVDTRAVAAELNCQRTAGFQVILPLDFIDAVVEIVGVFHVEALEHQQHAVAQARPQAQPVGGFHVGAAANRRSVLAHFFQAEAAGFFGKQAFKAFGTGEVKFETVRHGVSRALSNKVERQAHRPSDV